MNTSWQEFIVASTIGAAAVFALVGGYLNDKIGRKPVILLASVIFTSGSLCMAFADDKFMLVLGRMIVGTGIGELCIKVIFYPKIFLRCSNYLSRGVVSQNIMFYKVHRS